MEQMYAPYQPPWTINGARKYLKDIFAIHKQPFYLTLDVGHMVGQRKFMKPTKKALEKSLKEDYHEGDLPAIWLGSDSVYKKWYIAHKRFETEDGIQAAVYEIFTEMANYPYLFAEEKDGVLFKWIEELACYSPIIHMQQTNGITSSHAAFTPETR